MLSKPSNQTRNLHRVNFLNLKVVVRSQNSTRKEKILILHKLYMVSHINIVYIQYLILFYLWSLRGWFEFLRQYCYKDFEGPPRGGIHNSLGFIDSDPTLTGVQGLQGSQLFLGLLPYLNWWPDLLQQKNPRSFYFKIFSKTNFMVQIYCRNRTLNQKTDKNLNYRGVLFLFIFFISFCK